MPTQNTEPRLSPALSSEQLLCLASLFWAFSANRLFMTKALAERSFAAPATWGFAAALLIMLACLHYLLLAPLAHRRVFKPLLALLLLATALATHYMQSFGVVLDPTMLRNVLRTDVAETRELLSWTLLAHVAVYGLLPMALLWRVRLIHRPWPRALAWRLGGVVLALAMLVGAGLAVFQPLSSLMRNHRELRYEVTPGNLVWSLASALGTQARGAARPRQPIGLDATPGPVMASRTGAGAQNKPLLVVMVVGETARAANWGLSGYERQTTPQLAQISNPPLINIAPTSSCGTNTEVSVPCLFAPVGRRDYDESRIRGQQSLLHVAQRAGVAVHWRDNQSGCKGVCDGLPYDEVQGLNPAGLCADGHCLDEGLLLGLEDRIAQMASGRHKGGTQLLVLHMLGNHGPAYYKRYPKAFARFQPACESDDLSRCEPQAIVNAYDNALLYTDHVLATLVAKLRQAQADVDSAMLYVSDHGESLGEGGLFLHGMPWPMAPQVQKQVPFVMWLSGGAPAALGIDRECLARRAQQGAAHDHVFHTLLALLDVKTALYDKAWDLAAGCHVTH